MKATSSGGVTLRPTRGGVEDAGLVLRQLCDELGFFANLPPFPAHAESLVAADFFSVDTIFFKRLYVVIYVHLATRRILLASCTAEPNTPWVTQQAYWFGGS